MFYPKIPNFLLLRRKLGKLFKMFTHLLQQNDYILPSARSVLTIPILVLVCIIQISNGPYICEHIYRLLMKGANDLSHVIRYHVNKRRFLFICLLFTKWRSSVPIETSKMKILYPMHGSISPSSYVISWQPISRISTKLDFQIVLFGNCGVHCSLWSWFKYSNVAIRSWYLFGGTTTFIPIVNATTLL